MACDQTLAQRGRKSRSKGARGEREFAALCKAYGYDTTRTAQHCGKNGGEPDVKGLPGIHVEVKRTEALSLYPAMRQASRDAKEGEVPIVAHRRNGERWLVIMTASDWLEMYKKREGAL